MKLILKNNFFFVLLLFSNIIYSQAESVTKVLYKLVPYAIPSDRGLTREQKEGIVKENFARDKVECELTFTKNKSVFSLIEKPLLNRDFDYLREAVLVSDKYYNDVVNQKKTRFEELGGENLNIILPYHQYNWEITSETKKINDYTCYKAICRWNDFNMRRNSTDVFSAEAWFTPQIPSSFGPLGLDGLPGLVLEANYGASGIHFYIVKIEFNVENPKVKFDPPAVQYITEEEHQKRLAKEYENMGR
ncbi:GLPGLI family protein [Flavobacterium quisquiliarum]|uniref:GLPGLI family protein n=1 Tax=Flavobacterium quisquiliarum TaxID=1834436 RepID=A0ABV8W8L6_9FLAO|nr:GLPGLI family protein [Flavobacterium quisquiliarum]MBW1654473.1 GLPGLI family protein [Flavobacterium quisquiliarum]